MRHLSIVGGAIAVLLVALVAVRSIPAQPEPGPGVPAGAEKKLEAEAQTIDELIRKLTSIKEQKAALEQAEKKTVALLREKLKLQKQVLEKLGVGPEEMERPVPRSTREPEVPHAPPVPPSSGFAPGA